MFLETDFVQPLATWALMSVKIEDILIFLTWYHDFNRLHIPLHLKLLKLSLVQNVLLEASDVP